MSHPQGILEAVRAVIQLPDAPRSRWHRAGVSPRTERLFDVISGVIVALFATGWMWAIATARADPGRGHALTPATASVAAALTGDAPAAAYVTQAAVEMFAPLRGQSGKLRARIAPQGASIVEDTLPAGAHLQFSSGAEDRSAPGAVAPQDAGIWRVAIRVGNAIKPLTDFSVITMRPFSEKRRGRIGLYYIGSWPGERGRGRGPAYVNPSGFIEVTRENQDTRVSEHFRLRDFLTKDQPNVWPKYLVLELRLIDKLELVLSDLASRGIDVSGVRVMSGFRTPQYNTGGGDPRGRAQLSRHMYGDAADIYIDRDGNGQMDDLNRDGRVNIRDARLIEAAVERVERAHPALVGGTGVYSSGSGHGPFIHIDTRGFRARWVGSGGG